MEKEEKKEEKKKEKTGWKVELISWIQVLVSAAVIAFVLTTFVIANSEVPTSSMENTIMAQPGHRLPASLYLLLASEGGCGHFQIWLAMPGMQRHGGRR